MIDQDIKEIFQFELEPNEKLLWTGRPRTGIVFVPSDIFYIPFSIIWLAITIMIGEISYKDDPWSFFTIYISMFLAAGLYFAVGRFFYDSKRRAKTMYGVTDARVIIRSGIFSEDFTWVYINDLPEINLDERSSKGGTIILGSNALRISDLPGMGRLKTKPDPKRLEYLSDAQYVYSLLLKIKK